MRSNRMSKDRVRFFISRYDVIKYNEIFEDAFGYSLTSHPAHSSTYSTSCNELHEMLEIICRPSQFARFLIYRDKAGFKNDFKGLRADLFIPEEERLYLDVSKNDAVY